MEEGRSFRELESLGILDSKCANANAKVLKRFEESVVTKDGRYEVSLPWKGGAEEILEDSRATAVAQLLSLLKRLSRKNRLFQWYNDIIMQHLI